MVEFNNKTRITNLIKGLSAVTIYFIVSFFKNIPLTLLNINYDNLSTIYKEIYSLSVELILLWLIFYIFKDQYKKAWKDLKQNHWKYFSSNFKYYLLGLFLMMTSNALITLFGGGISGNEESIRNQFQIAPIFTYISAVFLAPILEESIFRLSFRNIFENKYIFILISGLVFGGLHLIGGIDSLTLLPLYLIAYCSFGFVFAYIFTKTNNIFVSMGFHLMHNGVLMSLQFLLFVFS